MIVGAPGHNADRGRVELDPGFFVGAPGQSNGLGAVYFVGPQGEVGGALPFDPGAEAWGLGAFLALTEDFDEDGGVGLAVGAFDGAGRPRSVCFASANAELACQDGQDNDQDGGIDWDGGPDQADPDAACVAEPWKDDELPVPEPGFGIGLAVAALLLASARRRRRA